jgi:hypothetical protein
VKSLVMSLATARLTQLVVDDEIAAPVRNQIMRRTPEKALDWVGELIECPACMSVWAGAGILAAEQIPFGRVLVRVLALSQAALIVKSLIERIDR